MTGSPPYRAITLGIHPNSRGFGWIAFDGPLAPYDWATYDAGKSAKHRKNERCLQKVEHLIRCLKPEAIVLERFDGPGSSRHSRIRNLCKAITVMAANEGVEVTIHSRKDIEASFKDTGARTRDEIADVVVRHVPALESRKPPKRRPWKSEDRRLAVFSAAAVVLTHYAYGMDRLFDDLKNAA